MRRIIMLSVAAALTFGIAFSTSAEDKEGKVTWHTSYDKALELAKKEKKPIMLEFTGSDWCPPCISLHKKVLVSKAFEEWAAKHVILLKLDFPRKKKIADELKKANTALAKKFGVRGFPTVMFLSHEEKIMGKKMVGYSGKKVEDWLKDAGAQIGKN